MKRLFDIKFFFLTLAYFLLFSTYSLPLAFFPLIAKERGLSTLMIGVVFSFLPFGGLISSLVFGKYMSVVGKKILFVLLNFFVTASIFGFGSLHLVTSDSSFLGLAIACRILQGIAIGGLASIIYGYIPTFYPDTVQERMIIMEFFLGISVTVSVNIGQVLYNAGGYAVPFYVIGSITFCILFLITFFLPSDKSEVKRLVSTEKGKAKEKAVTIGYGKFLKSFKFMIMFMGIVGNVSSKTFVSTNLTLHLESFENGADFLGISFLLLTSSFAVANLFFMKIPAYVDRRIFMILGLVFEAISLLFIGPETSFGLPKNLTVLGIGLFMLGFSSNFYFLPSLPEMVEAGNDLFNIEHENLINDMVSGFFTAASLSAEVIGPLIGSFLAQYLGMRIGALIFAGYLIFILILFVTCGGASKVFLRSKNKNVGLRAKQQTRSNEDLEMKLLGNN